MCERDEAGMGIMGGATCIHEGQDRSCGMLSLQQRGKRHHQRWLLHMPVLLMSGTETSLFNCDSGPTALRLVPGFKY